ncbi:hypothetical protein TELCIR_13252 [Teladorsagia circumcincta]|uniref:Ubiquitin-related modifier 1 n=1 Tax=Teladorsagia circumcincta TaxID=45464 RepID=A0A2G9U4C8_TELCI|nr:hypothetical protein TELCIR_13252 [Teladorsagia circumcincta]
MNVECMPEVAPLASQLFAFCSQLEPTSSVSPEISLISDHGKVSLPTSEDFVTVGDVVSYVNDVMLKDCDRRELLIDDGKIRPGVLVLVNDCDWELVGCVCFMLCLFIKCTLCFLQRDARGERGYR